MKTLYDVLEVSALAGPRAIDAAYQRLIAECKQQFDPAAGNQEQTGARLDAIKRAYAVLSHPDQRRDAAVGARG